MDKNCVTSKILAPSKKKYVLCQMPVDWTHLAVHCGVQATPRRDCVAVYTTGRGANLVYEGYVCPDAPGKQLLSALRMPPRQRSFVPDYERLLEKIRAEEAEAEAREIVILEEQRNGLAGSAANSEPARGVVRAEPSSKPHAEARADEAEEQIKAGAVAINVGKNKPVRLNLSWQWTASNSAYPLPEEILDRRESLLPGTEEFLYCFEPWEHTMDVELINYLENLSPKIELRPALV